MRLPFLLSVPVFVPAPADSWEIGTADSRVRTRDDPKDKPYKPSATSIVIVVIVLCIALLGVATLVIRILRRKHPNPKYIPTPFLKRLWTDWKIPAYRTTPRYRLSEDDDGDSSIHQTSHMRTAQGEMEDTLQDIQARQAAGTGRGAAVDRTTSVRSVLTLPAYRTEATENEVVVGREFERGGIDMVVELPTAEDEEALRDEEMETLYQIRVARRRHITEREERRERRRQARAQGDLVALEELRRAGRDASSSVSTEVEELRDHHQRIKETRQRAVSQVSYHNVGLVKADGTRIRANSTESERVGLLSDAASIAASARSTSGPGPSNLFHRRDTSGGSLMSISTARGNEPPGSPSMTTGGSSHSLYSAQWPPSSRSRASSNANTPRAGSSPEIIDAEEADLGDIEMPPHSPPGYDEVSLDEFTPAHSRGSRSGANSPYPEPPPDYPGPTQTRNNRLSANMADLASAAEGSQLQAPRTSRGVGGVPQLPSLRLNRLPQIVIEPSSGMPGDYNAR